MNARNRIILVVVSLCAWAGMSAQDVTGTWKTIDDRNGKAKAVIRIYEEEGRLFGHVKKILEEGKEDARCTACDGSRKDKPIVGMRIIDSLKKTGKHTWEGGKQALFDPEQGRHFRVKIWMNPDNPDELKVRGYLMFLFRTQTWQRVTGSM